MKDVKSSITMDKLVKQISPTTHAYSSKFDKSITLGKVEGSIEVLEKLFFMLIFVESIFSMTYFTRCPGATSNKNDLFYVLQAIRAALQILDEGGKIEDAKAVCEPGLLDQIMKWRVLVILLFNLLILIALRSEHLVVHANLNICCL